MEGAGILRLTEAMASLFSSPNQHARRTLFWEHNKLHVAYDWSKNSRKIEKSKLALGRRLQRLVQCLCCAATVGTSSLLLGPE